MPKKRAKKKAKKNTELNPSYQRELIECFKQGYAQFPGKGNKKGTEEQRLEVREKCRASNPRSSNYKKK